MPAPATITSASKLSLPDLADIAGIRPRSGARVQSGEPPGAFLGRRGPFFTCGKPLPGPHCPLDWRVQVSRRRGMAGLPRRRLVPILAGGATAVAIAAGGLVWWQGKQHYETTDNAFVAADK